MCWEIFGSPSCSGPRNIKQCVGSVPVQKEWLELGCCQTCRKATCLQGGETQLRHNRSIQNTVHGDRDRSCLSYQGSGRLELVWCYPFTASVGFGHLATVFQTDFCFNVVILEQVTSDFDLRFCTHIYVVWKETYWLHHLNVSFRGTGSHFPN